MISVSARRVFGSLFTFLIVAAFPLSSDAQTPEAESPRAKEPFRRHDCKTPSASRSTAASTKRCGSARCRPPTSSRSIPRTARRPPSPPRFASSSPKTPSTWASPATTRSRTSGSGISAAATSSCGSDDRFMWTIDTFLDERSGYFFEMNPSGLMADSLFGINGDNRAWDGIWNARVRHSEIGWTIEIEIPFRTLNFDPEQRHVGLQLPAHRPPQERGQHLDGMAAQSGSAPDDERRSRHRHHGRDAGPRSRRQAVRPADVGIVRRAQRSEHRRRTPTPGSISSTTRRRESART